MANLKLEIVTAERVVYSDDVDMVIAPGIIGELGILPRHAPLLTALQSGELRVRKDGDEVSMAITGGFMEVFQNKLTILADAAERAEGNRLGAGPRGYEESRREDKIRGF